jgi:hypothetical protein
MAGRVEAVGTQEASVAQAKVQSGQVSSVRPLGAARTTALRALDDASLLVTICLQPGPAG